MDRERIETILKEKTENYEELYKAGKDYIKEHEAELKERFWYARFLEKPLVEKQAVFWNGNACTFGGKVKEEYEKLRELHGEDYTYVWVIRNERPAEVKEKITWVKKNSPQYWEALAVSGLLMGEGNLPVSFRKRPGQVYIGNPQMPEKEEIDGVSLLVKELLKLDATLTSPGKGELLEKYNFQTSREDTRKKILILTNWKEEREHRYLIREILKRTDAGTYAVTVAVPRVMSLPLEKELEALPEEARKFIYRGRMTVTEKDFLLLRVLEKHPELYVSEPEIKAYVDGLMKEEWTRIWGEQKFDCVVLAGSLSVQQYLMAQALDCGKKVLVNMEFLDAQKSKNEEGWKQIVSSFDEVLTLPLLESEEEEEPEILELEGVRYYILDTWEGEKGRTVRKLLPVPADGRLVENEFNKKYLPMYPCAGKIKTGSR